MPGILPPGQLLVSEAGGAVVNLDGTPLDLTRGEVVAAHPDLLPQVLSHICS